MRFYKRPHQFYCGIDRHAKSMRVGLVNQAGEVLGHRNLPDVLSSRRAGQDGILRRSPWRSDLR